MYKIIVSKDSAFLVGKANSAVFTAISNIEGRRKWGVNGLKFEPTEHNIQVFVKTVGATVERDEDELVAEPKEFKPLVRKTNPFPHQKNALAHFRHKNVMALFMEQGTGKTKVAIDWADDLYHQGDITGVLVVSMNGVHKQWIESQYPTHCAVEWSGVYWKKRNNHQYPDHGLEVIAINWDGIKSKSGSDWVMEFCHRHSGKLLVIADEAHAIKNPRSQRYAAMEKIKGFSSHRALLTGTPIAKDLTDEWAMLKWLDHRILGIKYLTTFRAQYCLLGGFNNHSVVGHRNIDRFRELTAPYVFRVKKTDIGLLPKQYEDWEFWMNSTQKAMIRDLKSDLRLKINGDEVISEANAAVILTKIQQITNGFVIDDNKNVIRLMDPKDNPRALAALDWLNGAESKAIIWCKFREDILILKEAMKAYSCVYYHGGMADGERSVAVESWLREDGPQVFIATDAAGTGLNLQGSCNRALYYSEGFNAVNRWQKEDRIDRIGTVGITVHTDLIAVGGVDRNIARNRLKKQGISDAAVEGLAVSGQEINSEDTLADVLRLFLAEDANDAEG